MSVAAHLLSRETLHTAAPGVLDVIFGPDGAFVGAPSFRAPLWGRITTHGHDGKDHFCHDWLSRANDPRAYVWLHPEGVPAVLEGAALDLRTTAADRLAKLCARVCLKHIGVTDAPVSVYVFDDWERCGLEVYTSGTDRYRQRHFCWDGRDGGGNDHFLPSGKRGLFDLPVDVVARPQPDPISFLAALTLFLAPEIAALKDAP